MDPDVLEIPNVVRCNRHATGVSYSSNLSIGLGNWTPNEMARRDNLRKGAGSVAIKWQHSPGKKVIEGTLASHSMSSDSKSALLRAVARGSRVFTSPLARLGITKKRQLSPVVDWESQTISYTRKKAEKLLDRIKEVCFSGHG